MVRLESERPGTALAKTVAIFPDEPFLKSSICFSSSLVTCLADVESSSAREAVIVIVGSASGFFQHLLSQKVRLQRPSLRERWLHQVIEVE